MKRFTGSDEDADRATAARVGEPQHDVQNSARCPSEPEYEPVHGWTRRQRDDYLARNPGYRAAYEAEVQKRASGNGSRS